MKPVDPFGRRIYSWPFQEMKKTEKVLLGIGYREARKKPNLFFLKDKDTGVIFYADMRGREAMPIWEDPNPQFWWKFCKEYSDLEKTQIVSKHLTLLETSGCKYRTSCWCLCFCDKDFIGEGMFCSPECQKAYEESLKTKCPICGELVNGGIEKHHISYFPEKTIFVCKSCHTKIHHSDSLQHLKPKKNRQDFEEAKRQKAQTRRKKREEVRKKKLATEQINREKKKKDKEEKLERQWNKIRKYRYLD